MDGSVYLPIYPSTHLLIDGFRSFQTVVLTVLLHHWGLGFSTESHESQPRRNKWYSEVGVGRAPASVQYSTDRVCSCPSGTILKIWCHCLSATLGYWDSTDIGSPISRQSSLPGHMIHPICVLSPLVLSWSKIQSKEPQALVDFGRWVMSILK